MVQRPRYPAVDPLGLSPQGARQILQRMELRMGEDFALHPMAFVLAVTLEYIGLPPDLRASVLTRSGFGRLGLITATAVHVHPGWKGCLTLELVNFGDSPIILYPGLPVAQLVLEMADEDTATEGSSYQLATEPQYPNMWDDWAIPALRAFRDSFRGTSSESGM